MAKKDVIRVNGTEVKFFTDQDKDYISLTDIAKQDSEEPRYTIQNWLKNTNTVRYLYEWEQLHNPIENRVQIHTVLESATNNRFIMSPKKWIGLVNAVGITSKAGRNGGTYAHRDIALNFCYWLSPTFQIYLLKEFQRLKDSEARRLGNQWNVRREISKLNYRIHTEAIKKNLIPERLSEQKQRQGFIYANEADLLNVALFGMTAKAWRLQNPDFKGNIRDFATIEQLLVLSNLEAHNAEFIKEGLDHEERLDRLNRIAIEHMAVLVQYSKLNEFNRK